MSATKNARAITNTILMSTTVIVFAARIDGRPRLDVPENGPSCLVLEWMDPHELLPSGEQRVAQETSRILAGANIGAQWDWRHHGKRDKRAPSSAASPREHRLRVVLVPSEPSGPGWRLSPDTLGATVVGEDGNESPPAVYIFYNTLATSLRIREREDHRRSVRTTRALGRVVAHELAHAIAPSEPHGPNGLMRSSLEPRFLTANSEVTIDARWKHVLGKKMSRLCSPA